VDISFTLVPYALLSRAELADFAGVALADRVLATVGRGLAMALPRSKARRAVLYLWPIGIEGHAHRLSDCRL
jgi:hypothetical protein